MDINRYNISNKPKKRNKNISAKFNQEHEDSIRKSSRKLTEFMIEFKRDVSIKTFGVLLSNTRIKKLCKISDDSININLAYIEFSKKEYDVKQIQIMDIFSDYKIIVVNKKDNKDSFGNDTILLLVDISKI